MEFKKILIIRVLVMVIILKQTFWFFRLKLSQQNSLITNELIWCSHFKKENLLIDLKNCLLIQEELIYLGFMVLQVGLNMDLEKKMKVIF